MRVPVGILFMVVHTTIFILDMNTKTLHSFAQEIEHLTKTAGLLADWKTFAGSTIPGAIGRQIIRAPFKHPYWTLGALASVPIITVGMPAMDELYKFHLMGKQNRLAIEQNERLDNLQQIQQAQLAQAIGVAHPDLAESMRPKIVASPLS